MIEQSVSLASNGVVKVPGYEQLVRFGYTKNRGVYRLAVTATGEWEGLTIRCFWHVPDGKDPASALVVDGYVAVPASVTAQPGSGCITFEGSDGTKTVTSADLRYRVSANSGTEDGTEPEPGTPAWQQLVDAVHTDATAAEQAKTDAQTAAQQAGASAKKAGQALSDTIAAKENALKAIGDKQTAATQAVDTARDKALKQVEASTKAAQTAASEAATSAGSASQSAQEAADAISAVKARQNILIGTETGNPIAVDDAFPAPLCGLTVYGRSTQSGTPTPDAPVPIVSAGDSGSVAVTFSDGKGKTQTLTLPTPNGLPGIPVTSGGNYTDSTGQQWVCDEVDLERGVKVQRIGKVTPLSATDIFNKLANTEEVRIDNPFIRDRGRLPMLCNTFKLAPVTWNVDTPYIFSYAATGNASIAFRLPIGVYSETYFKEHPTTAYGILATPIETSLTSDEIAAYKALTAYGPDTVMQASDGAGVKLEYQRDVNIAIKRIEDAVASMT